MRIVKATDGATTVAQDADKPKPAAPAAPAPKPAAPAAAATSSGSKPASAVSKGDKGDSIHLKEKFRCRAIDLYDALTDPQRIMAFSRAPCEFRRGEQGAPFMMFGGNITGKNVVLEPGKTIEQVRH